MSRIGNDPIIIPAGVTIQIEKDVIEVNGPKGKLELPLKSEIKVEQEEGKVLVKRKKNDRFSRSLHGLTRTLINNMILGVTNGWSKGLELVGVGYRAAGGGDTLNLTVGYSHPVVVKAPAGITFTVSDNTKVKIDGIDKALVGQVAANVRAIKPPEVYKGKGIRFAGERVRRKPGKAGKAGGK